MSLDSKGLYILPIRSLMKETRSLPLFTNSLRLTALPLLATLIKLEVEMLTGYGMMPRSVQRSLVGREVLGSFSRSVAAQPLEGRIAASFPIEPPKNTGRVLASFWVENRVSIGEPFWWDLASKRKTWLPRSVYEWAR